MKTEDTDLSWLHTFDKDDLIELIGELLIEANKHFEYSNRMYAIKNTLYEWEQSAKAINDSNIKAAFNN
jgi:hypothetical protein